VFRERVVLNLHLPRVRWDAGPVREKDRIRQEWIAQLLGVQPKHLALQVRTHASVTWAGEEAFRRRLKKIQGRIEFAYASVVRQLQAHRLLTPAEAAGLEPALATEIHDG
jgi:hypothetical protein